MGFVESLRETWQGAATDKIARLAAAISYTTMFALGAVVIVLIEILGWLFGLSDGGHGHRMVESVILGDISQYAGPGAADGIRDIVAAVFSKIGPGRLAQAIGWASLVLAATGIFSTLQDALNTVWGIESTQGGGKQLLRDRLASVATFAVVGLALLLSSIANGAVGLLVARASAGALSNALRLLTPVSSVAVLTVAFAAFYKILPDVRLKWRDVWIGALASALLFVAGETAIGLYLRLAGTGSAYGAASSVLVTLLWIYYSALIFLLGAEFTKARSQGAVTTAPVLIRTLVDVPEGVDPRKAITVPIVEYDAAKDHSVAISDPKSETKVSEATPAASGGRRILVLFNRSAHSGSDSVAIAVFQDELRARGFEPLMYGVESTDQSLHVVASQAAGCDAIVVGGGDGSVRSLLPALLRLDLPLAVWPLGTANDFARSLGIETSAHCVDALAAWRPRRIDVAEVNGKYFINNVAIGLPTEAAARLTSDLKARLGVFAAVALIPALWMRCKPFTVELEVDGAIERRRTIAVLVGNGVYEGGFPVQYSGLANGKLHLVVCRARSAWSLIPIAFDILRKGMQPSRWIEAFYAEGVTIRTRKPKRLSADGDVVSQTPAVVTLHPNALCVLTK